MSNIREIDGIFVNLDTIVYIRVDETSTRRKMDNGGIEVGTKYFLNLFFNAVSSAILNRQAETFYKTKELAKERIREIIKMQNGVSRGFINKEGKYEHIN